MCCATPATPPLRSTSVAGSRALRYSHEGNLLGALKLMEGAEPLLALPMGIAVQKDGNEVYVVDCRHHRIRKVSKKDFR